MVFILLNKAKWNSSVFLGGNASTQIHRFIWINLHGMGNGSSSHSIESSQTCSEDHQIEDH